MQRNSAEMMLKMTNMRSLVGDTVPTRALEQFLMATKGDLEAAVDMCWNNNGVFPQKHITITDDNEKHTKNTAPPSNNTRTQPTNAQPSQNGTNEAINKKKQGEIEQIYEILEHQLPLDDISAFYDISGSNMNVALDKCLNCIELKNTISLPTSDSSSLSPSPLVPVPLSATSTPTPSLSPTPSFSRGPSFSSSQPSSIEVIDDSYEYDSENEENNKRFANNNSNNNNVNNNNNNNVNNNNNNNVNNNNNINNNNFDNKYSNNNNHTHSNGKKSVYNVDDEEAYGYRDSKPKREGSKRARIDDNDEDELFVEGLDDVEGDDVEEVFSNNRKADNNKKRKVDVEEISDDEQAAVNKDVMDIYEALDRVLAPSMIAEIYEKLERDKNVTLARCFDYVKTIKKNKNQREGSSFEPVDVDGPVARRLDYKDTKPVKWPKLLGSFVSTVILMGCAPLPDNAPVYLYRKSFGDAYSVHVYAEREALNMLGTLLQEHAKLLAPLLGEQVRTSCVSLGTSFNPHSVGSNLEMPIYMEVYLTHLNLITEYDFKRALGTIKKKKKNDQPKRPLGDFIHRFFPGKSTSEQTTPSLHMPRSEDNFDMEALGDIFGNQEKNLPKAEPSKALTVELRDYQQQGLWWLLDRERNSGASENPMWEKLAFETKEVFYYNSSTDKISLETPEKTILPKGGLLCDDMGLGKTIQSISLIITNPLPDNFSEENKETEDMGKVSKSTLILCPVSLVTQWKSEIDKFVKRGHVKTFVYYGKERDISMKQLSSYDIVITSHSIVASEFFASLTDEEKKKRVKADLTPGSLNKAKSTSTLHKIKWWRIIVDEAHAMRTRSTNIAKAIHYLHAVNRWCLTGTPIQNKLEDLFSLMRFLRVEPLQSYSWWLEHIEKPLLKGDQQAVDLLRTFLTPLLLRRTKTGKITDALNLPSRQVDIVFVDFNEQEKKLYQSMFANSKEKFKELMRRGAVMANYANVLLMLLRLRQVCDHPKLVEDAMDGTKDAQLRDAVAVTPAHDARCALCCDLLENPMLAPCCGQCFCRECILVGLLSMKDSDNAPSKCPACSRPLEEAQLEPIGTGGTQKDAIDVEKGRKQTPQLMSSKIDILMAELKKVSHQKTVIFSQWTKMINLVQESLGASGLGNNFVRLDGTMSLQQRDRALKDFKQVNRYKIMLISLKAGGVGLNLTHANNVFLLDPWWNPAVEDQAIDRVHRIGQTQSVLVKRLIMKGSIEEQILLMQQKKQELVQTAIGNKNATGEPIGNFKLRLEDLQELFGEPK
eukprot:Phypoly_transcript_00816.p1 GENE.Phypoly_transcript_00816~~Phypoly_transcript_00816.p1  ORF type:complete len:1274 (+),score=280.63 Phypoly_transcript_00816:101-3922(+)